MNQAFQAFLQGTIGLVTGLSPHRKHNYAVLERNRMDKCNASHDQGEQQFAARYHSRP
ncbi:MAG TPA: hypothetical protein VNA15_10390 [Candidatus Angelobacter sp.]|nr:hypothetical protein [Candidatus Angelobacter sp.]